MRKLPVLAYLAIAGLCLLSFAAVTQFDLTTQVKGILPIANGGTNAATTSANFLFAGPTSGSAAAPSFRLAVAADMPFPPPITNITAVTANANVTTDQNLMAISIPGGATQGLNVAGRMAEINGAGIYTTCASTCTGTITWKVRLCSVSGCGSGTVVTLASWTTGNVSASASNMPWLINGWLQTDTTGASGTLELHAKASTVLGTVPGATAEVRLDGNTGPNATAIDLTATTFLQFTASITTASASNSFKQLQAATQFVN